MNKLSKAIIISAAMSVSAFSVNASGYEMGYGMDYCNGDSKMDQGLNKDNQQMIDMCQSMHKNQSVMQELRKEKNEGKRAKLMQQHRESMQQQMHMMNGMKHGMMGSDTMDGLSPEDMSERMNNMGLRMEMMQMMMNQMMERQDIDDEDAD
ncbi:MAG: hypothetical protein ACI9KN_001603 [Gammaproteobacteria bacterium]|jgi:hypothetical protein